MTIVRGKTKPAGLRIVIYGPAGVGKTTLASKLPDALFLDYEDGTHGINVAKAEKSDLPKSFASVKGVFKEFSGNHQGFKNIVIDTADKLEEVLDHSYSAAMKNPVDSVFTVNDYGRTVSGFTTEFGTLLDRGTDLVNTGVNLIVLAHEQIRKKEVLEGYQTYDHSELKLSKGNTKLLMQWADVVIFVNYKTIFIEANKQTGERAHAESGKRWCFTAYCNDWEAKHRSCIDLPDDCSLDKMIDILPKAIAEAISENAVQKPTSEESKEEKAKAALAKKREAKAAEEAAAKPASDAQPENKEPAPASAPAEQKSDRGIVNEFRTLLRQYEMKEEGIVKYADRKFQERYGKHSSEVPVDEWPDDFIGWLIRGISNGKITPEKVNN